MTLKEIIALANNEDLLYKLDKIRINEKNKCNMTLYEQKCADEKNKKLAKEIKYYLESYI